MLSRRSLSLCRNKKNLNVKIRAIYIYINLPDRFIIILALFILLTLFIHPGVFNRQK